MENRKNNFYFTIYLIGIIAGLGLTILSTWGDLEAAFYGFDRTGGLRLSSLSCPILMSSNETSSFSIEVKNSTDRKLSPSVKTDISSTTAPISTYEAIVVEPGETKKMEWAIGPENIDLNRFIFARAWIYASYPLPDREATCGVMIHPLPVSGNSLTWVLTSIALLGMGVGVYGQRQAESHIGIGMKVQRYILLAILVVVGLISAYLGIWLLGVVVLALSLLVVVISIMHSVKI